MKSKFRFSLTFEILKTTAVKNFYSLFQRFLDVATKPTKHSTQKIGHNFLEPEQLPLEKKLVLARFEPRTFAVPGVFDATWLSVEKTL